MTLMIWDILAIGVLVAAALADGITTVQFIKDGRGVEVDPVLVKLYGTNTPKTWQVLGIGMGIISAESALAYFLMQKSLLWAIPILIQAGAHAYFAYQNSKL